MLRSVSCCWRCSWAGGRAVVVVVWRIRCAIDGVECWTLFFFLLARVLRELAQRERIVKSPAPGQTTRRAAVRHEMHTVFHILDVIANCMYYNRGNKVARNETRIKLMHRRLKRWGGDPIFRDAELTRGKGLCELLRNYAVYSLLTFKKHDESRS